MAIILESTYDGAATLISSECLMTNSEVGTYGEAMVITPATGRLTKCGATARPDVILNKTTAGGTDVATEYVKVREEQVFLVNTTGTFSNFILGQCGVNLDATGLLANAAALTGGKMEIVGLDAVKSRVRVRFMP